MQKSLWVKEAKEGSHKNNSPGSSSGGLHDREKKKGNILNISTPNISSDRERYERSHRTTPSTYVWRNWFLLFVLANISQYRNFYCNFTFIAN